MPTRYGFQVAVYERNTHCTLSDRGCDSFDRPVPHVPGGENAWQARFKGQRAVGAQVGSFGRRCQGLVQ